MAAGESDGSIQWFHFFDGIRRGWPPRVWSSKGLLEKNIWVKYVT